MSARAIDISPAVLVSDADDKAAVLMRTGVASLGLSIAEARFTSQKLARAADEAEYRLAMNQRLRDERDAGARYRSWSERAADEAGKPEHGEI